MRCLKLGGGGESVSQIKEGTEGDWEGGDGINMYKPESTSRS